MRRGGVYPGAAQIKNASVSATGVFEQTNVDRAIVGDEELIGTGIGTQRISVARQGVHERHALSLVETDVELVAVQDIKRPFLVEGGVGNDESRPGPSRHRMLDAGPAHAKVVGLTNVEVARVRLGAISRIGPVKFAVRSPGPMAA